MESQRFKNINILNLAHIVFYNVDVAKSIIDSLSSQSGILEKITEEIQKQSTNILVDNNTSTMNRHVEENLTHLSHLHMLLKKKGVGDANT